MQKVDFTVVILATKSIVGHQTDLPQPPFLIPFCGQPLIIHHIVAAVQSGFNEVIVVHTEKDNSVQTSFYGIKNSYTDFFKNLHILFIPVNESISSHSVDILKVLDGVVLSDFILINGNVMFNFPLYRLADYHRTSESSCTIVLKDRGDKQKSVPGEIEIKKPFILYVEGSLRLVSWEASDSTYQLSKKMLREFPCVSIAQTLDVCFVYVFSLKIIKFIKEMDEIQRNVEYQLVPWLVNGQKDHIHFTVEETDTVDDIDHHDENASLRPAEFPVSDEICTYGYLLQGEYCERVNSKAVMDYVRNITERGRNPPLTLLGGEWLKEKGEKEKDGKGKKSQVVVNEVEEKEKEGVSNNFSIKPIEGKDTEKEKENINKENKQKEKQQQKQQQQQKEKGKKGDKSEKGKEKSGKGGKEHGEGDGDGK